MADALPSDAKMQAFLELQVDKAEDLTLLSRTILKEGLAKKFKLSTEQRALLDSDDHYKKSIKGWINDAVAKRQEADAKPGPSSEANEQLTRKGAGKPSNKESIEEEEDKGAMSEFSSLEDDEEPKKKKARKSKGSPSMTTQEGTKTSKTSTKTTGDPLETKLKKLKALVLQCGTRKPWKRLYEEARCPDEEEAASDEQKTKAKKGQISVVEEVLVDLGMTRPFTKAQAAEIQRQKEIKEDLETIQVANMTEKSTTRGGKERQSSSKTETSSSKAENKAPVAMHAPPEVRKFNRSLADFAAELNED